ncbi:MAG: hypothetical protein ACK56I_27695, partial [bacterium]
RLPLKPSNCVETEELRKLYIKLLERANATFDTSLDKWLLLSATFTRFMLRATGPPDSDEAP